jgi:hypothetical protein
MRKIKEVLRLKWEQGFTNRTIARSVSIARSTVGEYVRRARDAGLGWPLPAELDEAELEQRLFPPPPVVPAGSRLLPDWCEIHGELKRKGVTLFLCKRQTNPPSGVWSRCDRLCHRGVHCGWCSLTTEPGGWVGGAYRR